MSTTSVTCSVVSSAQNQLNQAHERVEGLPVLWCIRIQSRYLLNSIEFRADAILMTLEKCARLILAQSATGKRSSELSDMGGRQECPSLGILVDLIE